MYPFQRQYSMTSFFLCFLPAEIAVDLVVSLWVQTELLPAVWAGEGHQNRLIVHFPGITSLNCQSAELLNCQSAG